MTWFAHELRLIVRSRLSLAALAALLVLTGLSITSGLHMVERQHATIARLASLHERDVAVVAARYAQNPDAGDPAYYTFYATADPPTNEAFMALGFRDLAPFALRVRALGLQAQLYDGETFNPELALAGGFDFAFLLIYLLPLFVMALLYDLVSAERQAGRLGLLLAMAGGRGRLWCRRAGLRLMLLFLCVALPLIAGAVVADMSLAGLGIALAATGGYLAFWGGVSLLVAAGRWRSSANAMMLMAIWVILTLVLPTVASLVVTRAIPVPQGVDLMLAQRQAVHGAWEIPREDTMRRFYAAHPEWRHSAALPRGFHWKWYFAFHQNGDDSVADGAKAYRDGLRTRQAWTDRLGWVLPGVAVQSALHRAASTDLGAQLAYQDRIAAFHRRLLAFYYPYLFNDRPFGRADFARRPRFRAPPPAEPSWDADGVIVLLAGIAFLAAGLLRLRRVRIS